MKFFSKYTLFILLGVASWAPIVIINFNFWFTKTYYGSGVFGPELPTYLRMSYYAFFILANAIMVEQIQRRVEKFDVIDLLWKLLVIGISGISLIFLVQIVGDYMGSNKGDIALVASVSSSIGIYGMLLFSLSTIFIYRKLIMYQKNIRKVISWRLFILILFLGIARLLIPNDWGIAGLMYPVLIPGFLIVTLLLSANVNWTAYLNFNQKLKSLFLIFVIVLLFVAFYIKFPFASLAGTERIKDVFVGEFIIFGFLFVFPLIYTLISGLVLLFNLPTSSVFEQRSSEITTLQRINQSIQSNLKVADVLTTLMDASLLTSNATGGWIELIPESGDQSLVEVSYTKNISREEIDTLREKESFTKRVIKDKKHLHIKNIRKLKALRFTRSRIRSLLILPIFAKEVPVGVVYLTNELANSFEEATITTLSGLTEQAGLAIENADLVRQSIDFERYMEQVKIARQVQEQILPPSLPGSEHISFHVMSQDAEEIGGDFYDVHHKDGLYKIALGDVSGKGTEAAFYMAETKGIFQALTHLDLSVRDFIVTSNKAISKCFNRGNFMTLTYLHIYMDRREIELLRAGHCPTLRYDSQNDVLHSHEAGGPGLGIIRSDTFGNFMGEPETIGFNPGDLLILFTDGILEARDDKQEEFGIEKVKQIVTELRKAESKAIAEALLEEVMKFSGGAIDDDYTILVIKFT